MKNGQLARIEVFLKRIMCEIKFRSNIWPLLAFMHIFTKIRIFVIITSLLVAGKRVFIPVPVSPYKQVTLPLQWLSHDINKNKRVSGVSFINSALFELERHYNGTSKTIQMVETHHQSAISEFRYNIHYRWQLYR